MLKKQSIVFSIILVLTIVISAHATSYYVKSGGNDNLDGLSDNTAWKTMSKVNSFKFQNGDDVYFRCNDQWVREKLTIHWSGTESNAATVGAYYTKNNEIVHGVYGKKPTINGDNYQPTSSQWNGLVRVSSQSFVTVKNLNIINSEGEGLEFFNSSNVQALNIDVYNTYQGGIEFWEVENGLAKNCTVQRAAMIYIENPGNGWPAAIGVNKNSHGVRIKGNKVYNNFGEGIGLYKDSYNNIVEFNTCFSNRADNIYIDHGKGMQIRFNMVYGTTDTTYWRSTSVGMVTSRGISINDEAQYGYASSENNAIYGNLIANCGSGIVLGTQHVDSVIKDTSVYNNTVIGCRISVRHYDGPWRNSIVANNIFQSINSGYKLYDGRTSTPGLVWRNNCWSSEVPGDLSGDNDIIRTVQFHKKTGWNTIANNDSLSTIDFKIDSDSQLFSQGSAINSGTNLLDCQSSQYASNIFVVKNTDQCAWPVGADISISSQCANSLVAPMLEIVVR